jgi:translation initiation factor IF-2
MAEITVKQLAQLVDRSVETLLIQMKEAGLPARGADGLVSDAEKQQLVSFLKRSHGDVSGDNQQITLKRKTLSTIKTPVSGGKAKTVNVEVRKTRTFVKPAEGEVSLETLRQAAIAEEAARKEAEEQARLAAERQQAEEAARKAAEELAAREADKKDVKASVATPTQQPKDQRDKKLAVPKSGAIKADKKEETPEAKAKREAEQSKQRAAEEAKRKQEDALRREAEEKARQRTLEQAQKIAAELRFVVRLK